MRTVYGRSPESLISHYPSYAGRGRDLRRLPALQQGRHAVIDHQGSTRDVRRLIAGQEGRRLPDFFGRPQPPQDLPPFDGSLGLLRIEVAGEDPLDQRRVDPPWTNRINPDLVLAVVDRHDTRQRDDATLAGRVRRRASDVLVGMDRGDVDDRPATGGLDVWDGVFRAQEHPAQVHRQTPVPFLGRGLEYRLVHTDPGVVDQHVQGLEPFDGAFNHPLDRLFIGDVALDEDRTSPVLLQLGCGLLADLAIDVGDDHAGALLEKDGGDPLPDPHGSTGDDGDLVFKFHVLTSCIQAIA